jgi:hypothetical protein
MPSYDDDYNFGWEDDEDTSCIDDDMLEGFEGNPDGDDFDDILETFGF